MNKYAQKIEDLESEVINNLSIIAGTIGEGTDSYPTYKIIELSSLDSMTYIETTHSEINSFHTKGLLDHNGLKYDFDYASTGVLCELLDSAISYWLNSLAEESIERVKSWGDDFDIKSFDTEKHVTSLVKGALSKLVGYSSLELESDDVIEMTSALSVKISLELGI
jgi:hypothetical protein